MSVEVRITSVLQRVVGAKAVRSEGRTVGEVLAQMSSRYPGFMEQITAGNGELHRFVNVYINDEDIRFLQALDTPVNEGDVVSILPALAGGCAKETPAGVAGAQLHPERSRRAMRGGLGVSPSSSFEYPAEQTSPEPGEGRWMRSRAPR